MILRWLVSRRERAGAAWMAAYRRVQAFEALYGTVDGYPATRAALTRARRRLARADALLDLWTAGGRR